MNIITPEKSLIIKFLNFDYSEFIHVISIEIIFIHNW